MKNTIFIQIIVPVSLVNLLRLYYMKTFRYGRGLLVTKKRMDEKHKCLYIKDLKVC